MGSGFVVFVAGPRAGKERGGGEAGLTQKPAAPTELVCQAWGSCGGRKGLEGKQKSSQNAASWSGGGLWLNFRAGSGLAYIAASQHKPADLPSSRQPKSLGLGWALMFANSLNCKAP